MANRVLRDWTDSDKIHSLSCEAERFFTRLIMKVDDYGRYISNPQLLRASLFPLHEKIKEDKIILWLNECVDADLILLYEVENKKYLEIKMFNQTLKIRRSKYPPSNNEDRIELQSGYVYLIGTDYKNPVKIGFSINPWARLKEITANNHERLEILLTIKADKKTESTIHKCLKNLRTKNEWFNLNPEVVDVFIGYSKSEITQEFFYDSLRSYSYELRTSTEIESESESERKPETRILKETEGKSGKKPQVQKTLEFEEFEKWIEKNAPQVAKLKNPFTLEEFEKIKKEYTGAEVKEILLQMQNKKDLLKKYVSAYLTALNWLKRNEGPKKAITINQPTDANGYVKP